MKTRIEAKPQNLKGDDGYDTFSIRIKHSLTVKLDETADASGRSRNYVISRILEDGVENTVIVKPNNPNLSTFLPPHLFALLPALIRRVSPKGCSI